MPELTSDEKVMDQKLDPFDDLDIIPLELEEESDGSTRETSSRGRPSSSDGESNFFSLISQIQYKLRNMSEYVKPYNGGGSVTKGKGVIFCPAASAQGQQIVLLRPTQAFSAFRSARVCHYVSRPEFARFTSFFCLF